MPKLVYTSTVNVVFGGQSITCGDESLPYFPAARHVERYSATKAQAEQAVLAANMAPLQDESGKIRARKGLGWMCPTPCMQLIASLAYCTI